MPSEKNSPEKKLPLPEVERCLEEHIAAVMTFLAEPHTARCIHDQILRSVERAMIKVALERSNGVKSKAAAYLGINRNSLQAKMVRFGMGKDIEA